ncbi:purine-cytosine permease [Russula compacta]|nr:purine-cytosine permease [Russula compacta]
MGPQPSSPHSNLSRAIGDPAKAPSLTMGPDEKNSFEFSANPTRTNRVANLTRALSRKLLTWGVEARGIRPIAAEDRKETHFIKIFFVWLSANMGILSCACPLSFTHADKPSIVFWLFRRFSAGTLGPVAYGLGLRDSCLVILFFNLLCAVPPAYFTTWGPKLGLRQLCSSRYTFGYYGAMVPSVLAIISGVGFCILNSILGGQALASIANISWTVGIVIIAVISLFVSFCGIRVLNWYENCVWIPVFIVFVVATAVGGKDFVDPPTAPATAAQIFNFGGTIAGFTVTWAVFSSDYTTYFHPRVSSWRIFMYSYLGLNIPIITLQCLGAAAAISAPSVPKWNAGYADGNVGGLLNAMLSPVGRFGKALTVVLSLSVTANNAPTIYSICMGIQTLIPSLVVVPRYVFSVLATAVVILLSIVGQHKFYSTLSNFLGIIGYWTGAWISAICVEHLYFRNGASALSFAFVIPSMNQAWYTGPIARTTGDIGFEVAFVATALLYIPLRHLEKRWRGV